MSLVEAGHEVFLVATNTDDQVVSGVQVVNVASRAKGRLSRMLKASKAVYKKAISLDADIYHFHDPELLRFALRLKRKGKKVIYDVHEDVPKQIMGKFWINKYLRKTVATLFKTYEDYIAKRVDCVVAATPFIAKRFTKINTNTVNINNYPLMRELSVYSDWNLKKNEICYVGGITQIRGLEFVVDALDYLDDIQFNLAGNFSHGSPDYEIMIKAKKSWKKVKYYGFVNRTEVAQIFKQSKAGIVTLLPFPNHIDSQPIKMFEYMSAGIPVICSNFPLWKEIIVQNHCGICVDPENPKDIARAVQHILDNPKISREMGENGRKAVIERYNWDIEKQKLVAVYNQL